jgi:hypothetical protein
MRIAIAIFSLLMSSLTLSANTQDQRTDAAQQLRDLYLQRAFDKAQEVERSEPAKAASWAIERIELKSGDYVTASDGLNMVGPKVKTTNSQN